MGLGADFHAAIYPVRPWALPHGGSRVSGVVRCMRWLGVRFLSSFCNKIYTESHIGHFL